MFLLFQILSTQNYQNGHFSLILEEHNSEEKETLNISKSKESLVRKQSHTSVFSCEAYNLISDTVYPESKRVLELFDFAGYIP